VGDVRAEVPRARAVRGALVGRLRPSPWRDRAPPVDGPTPAKVTAEALARLDAAGATCAVLLRDGRLAGQLTRGELVARCRGENATSPCWNAGLAALKMATRGGGVTRW
jgi:hypothetical protein